MVTKIIYKQESFQIIGKCIEVYNTLGKGFNESVYGDALAIEMISHKINFEREVTFNINYKGKPLRHSYIADFIINNKIVLELKAVESIHISHIKQTLNYLAATKLKLGLIVNFGEDSLIYKRIVL